MTMRMILAAAAVLAASVGAARAESLAGASAWSHPQGLFSVAQPSGWPAPEDMTRGGAVKQFVMGGADAECWFIAFERPDSASASPMAVNAAFLRPLTQEQWISLANNHQIFDGAAGYVESAVDQSGPFVIQTATLTAPESGRVTAALQGRPGQEFWTFCTSYDGQDRSALFQAIAKSLATPRDAELAAQIGAAAAAPASPPSGSE